MLWPSAGRAYGSERIIDTIGVMVPASVNPDKPKITNYKHYLILKRKHFSGTKIGF